MKKVFLALAVIATVACMASCKKTCTCTTTVMGVSVEDEIDLDQMNEKYGVDVKKCSDMNSNVAGVGTIVCK